MQKRTGVALLLLGFLASLFPQTPGAEWKDAFDRAFASTIESRTGRVSPAVQTRYRLLLDNRLDLSDDPAAAGVSAALLLFRYEKDIRSGYDLQEAGARLFQAMGMMSRSGNPEKDLRKLEMFRKGAAGGNRGSPGFAGNTAPEAGRVMRGRDKGN